MGKRGRKPALKLRLTDLPDIENALAGRIPIVQICQNYHISGQAALMCELARFNRKITEVARTLVPIDENVGGC